MKLFTPLNIPFMKNLIQSVYEHTRLLDFRGRRQTLL